MCYAWVTGLAAIESPIARGCAIVFVMTPVAQLVVLPASAELQLYIGHGKPAADSVEVCNEHRRRRISGRGTMEKNAPVRRVDCVLISRECGVLISGER